MDYSHRLNGDGTPKRLVDDVLMARHMLRRGFGESDVRHLLGHLPDVDVSLDDLPQP